MIKKKLLMMSASLLLLLMLGFAMVPTHVAHADTCNGKCGQDPVVAGCTSLQFIMASRDFTVSGQTWEIRLRSTNSTSTACRGNEWASLVLKSGSNPNLSNSTDIQVVAWSRDPDTGSCSRSYDILNSSNFGSGAYTNMIPIGNRGNFAEYQGNGQDPIASTGSAC